MIEQSRTALHGLPRTQPSCGAGRLTPKTQSPALCSITPNLSGHGRPSPSRGSSHETSAHFQLPAGDLFLSIAAPGFSFHPSPSLSSLKRGGRVAP